MRVDVPQTSAKVGLDALLARTEHLKEVAQVLIDYAGATGSVLLWETQLLNARQVPAA